MLFISDIALGHIENGIFKTNSLVYRNTHNFFDIFRPMGGGEFLKFTLTLYIVLNIVILIDVIQAYRSMFPVKNGINSINILYTGSRKSFLIHYSIQGKNI